MVHYVSIHFIYIFIHFILFCLYFIFSLSLLFFFFFFFFVFFFFVLFFFVVVFFLGGRGGVGVELFICKYITQFSCVASYHAVLI